MRTTFPKSLCRGHEAERFADQETIAFRVIILLVDQHIDQRREVARVHLAIAIHLHYNVALKLDPFVVAEYGRPSHAPVLRGLQSDDSLVARLDGSFVGVVSAAIVYDYEVVNRLGHGGDDLRDMACFVVRGNDGGNALVLIHLPHQGRPERYTRLSALQVFRLRARFSENAFADFPGHARQLSHLVSPEYRDRGASSPTSREARL